MESEVTGRRGDSAAVSFWPPWGFAREAPAIMLSVGKITIFQKTEDGKMTTRKIIAALLASVAFGSLAYASDFTSQQLVVIKTVTIVSMAEQNCPGVHLNNSAIALVLGKANLDPGDSAFLPAMQKAADQVIADTHGDTVALCEAVKADSMPFRAMVHIDQ
jgi:hypothetical protein